MPRGVPTSKPADASGAGSGERTATPLVASAARVISEEPIVRTPTQSSSTLGGCRSGSYSPEVTLPVGRSSVGQETAVGVVGRLAEADEDDPVERVRVLGDEALRLGDRDRGRVLEREAVDAGADRREGDRPDAALARDRERVPVAARQQLRLALAAAVPDRPDGVDHPGGRQPVAAGDLRLAGRAAAEPTALLEQLRPGGAVYRAVDAAAAEQAAVRRVDDRVDALLGDVALLDRQLGRHRLLGAHLERPQPVAAVVRDQPLDQLAGVVVWTVAQRDPIAERLAHPLERRRLVAVGQEYPEDRLEQRRLGRDVVALLRAALPYDRQRVVAVADLPGLVDDPVRLLVDRRHALLGHGPDLGEAGLAEPALRDRLEGAGVLVVPVG